MFVVVRFEIVDAREPILVGGSAPVAIDQGTLVVFCAGRVSLAVPDGPEGLRAVSAYLEMQVDRSDAEQPAHDVWWRNHPYVGWLGWIPTIWEFQAYLRSLEPDSSRGVAQEHRRLQFPQFRTRCDCGTWVDSVARDVTHCAYHHANESTIGAFRVCGECLHAWSAEDLVEAHCSISGDSPTEIPGHIDCCPLCVHDF